MKRFLKHLEVFAISIIFAIASLLMIIAWLRLFDIV